MQTRVRHWRMSKRRRCAEVGMSAFLVALICAVTIQRLLHTVIYPTLGGCGDLVFWLDGWDDGRSVFQLSGATILGFCALYLLQLRERSPLVVKIAVGVILLMWAAAYDKQAELFFPDAPHPLATMADALLPAPDIVVPGRATTYSDLLLSNKLPLWVDAPALAEACAVVIAEQPTPLTTELRSVR